MTGVEQTDAGSAELLADADRPGGWLLLVDRIRQSYVDLDDPTYLDFEYIQAFADVLQTLPDGPIAITHIGGGACSLARYVAVTRPGSSQIVLEPDAALTALVRAQLPFPRHARVRIRPVDGRTGVTALPDAGADVLVLDAFAGGRVPAELTTLECIEQYARVLRTDGLLLINVADGPPPIYLIRLVATIRAVFPSLVLIGDPGVLKARRFGNIVIAASRSPLAVDDLRRAAASAPVPRSVVQPRTSGAELLTDADPLRSPPPPFQSWRVAAEYD